MKHQKFLNKISFFSLDEVNDFKLFLNYFYNNNKDNVYVKLISILCQTHPNYNEEYNEEILFKKLFSDEKINIAKLNNLYTGLNKAFEEYIIYNQIQKQPLDKQLLRINSALVLNDTKSVIEEIEETRKLVKKSPKISDKTYHINYELNVLEHKYNSRNDQRKGDLNLQELADSFDKYWIIRKLEIYSMMLSRKQMFNLEFKDLMINELLNELPNTTYFNEPLIYALYLNIQLQLNPTENNYLALLKSLEKHHTLFTQLDTRSHYGILENMIPIIYKADEYSKKIFELYKIQIAQNSIIIENKISPTLYNNIVTFSLRLNELKWVNEFIESYKIYLPNSQFQDYYSFNKARILFVEKKYGQILKLIHDIEYSNIDIKLGVKRLLAKVYYEMKEYQLLDHHLKSVKIFIFRHSELSIKHQDMHKEYLKHINKLLKIATDPNRNGVTKLLTNIKSSNTLIDKSWMIEKVGQL